MARLSPRPPNPPGGPDTLQAYNTGLEDGDTELTAGTTLALSQPVTELLQVKVIERQTYVENVQYDTIETESEDYSFGERVVLQSGQNGRQEVVQDVTYIGGVPVQTDIVQINMLEAPVTEQVAVGTRLASGMTAQVGSGTFYWPVPQYRYVSRWMSASHKGADIVAPYARPSSPRTAAWCRPPAGTTTPTATATMSSLTTATAGQRCTGICPPSPSPPARRWKPARSSAMWATGYSFGNHCHFEMYLTAAWSAHATISRICSAPARRRPDILRVVDKNLPAAGAIWDFSRNFCIILRQQLFKTSVLVL